MTSNPADATERTKKETGPQAWFEMLQHAAQSVQGGEGLAFGRYRLLELVGKGGMGLVYRAFDTHLGRIVALKQLNPLSAADRTDVDRFLAEARSSARLKHPNIVEIYDIGEVEGISYFTMDWITGKMLHKVEGLADTQKVEIARSVADALDYAHQMRIIHRDIKPTNIMISDEGRPILMDFGIAFDQSRKDRITLTGEVVGTPGYMSPEQVAGDIEKLDGRTDVYSLGVTLYELVVGRRPFIGSTPMAILKAIQHDEPPRPRALNPRVDPEIEGVILKAMSKDPSRRYQTASEFSRDLSLFLAGEPTSAGKLTFRKIVSHKVRRHWRALGVAALAVAVAGALAYLTYELMTLRESSVPLDSRAGQTRLAYNRGMHALSEAKTLPGAAERRPLLGQALQQFTLATETDPAFIEGRRRRAELHMILARPAEAVREYESLENAASDLLRAWIRLLLVYPDYPEYRRKELEGLLRGRELSRVIESIGQYPPAVVGQVSRALGAMLRSSPREALTALGGIPASEMRAEFIALRGRAALEDGDPDRALDLLMTAVSRDPWFPEAWALLADLHARRGRFDAARDAADRACEHLEQPFPPVLHARAMTLVQWGDLKAAEDLLESAVAQAPGRADLAHDLGVVLLVRGEPRLAMDAFERALKLHPDSYVSGYMLACAIATEAKSETAVGRQRDLIVRAFKALSHSLLACEKSGGFSARGGPDLRPYERLWKLMRPRADDASRDPMLALLRLQPAWDREIRPILRRLR